jgi:hypothetical protein
MPAYYLSRHPMDGLNKFCDTLYLEQQRDPLCQEINFFLKNNEHTPHCCQQFKNLIKSWDNLLWLRKANNDYPDRNVILLPASLK